MSEPDWAKLLSYLYNKNGEVKKEADTTKGSEEPTNKIHEEALYDHLREELDLNNESDEAIIESHKHLQNLGLVRFHTHSDYAGISLEPDGFDIAHEREMNKNQIRTNVGIAILTVFLVVGSLLQGYSAYLSQEPVDQLALLGILIIALITGFSVFHFMTGQNLRR